MADSAQGWRRATTADGTPTLVHAGHGEACHNRVGAWLESVERYANACRVGERCAADPDRPLRLLDVGTGLGWNLAAALRAAEIAGGVLQATTLEADAAVLDAAARLCAEEAVSGEPARWWRPVQDALAAARARPGEAVPLAGRHRLRLLLGDARRELARLPADERFDACFFDPFSHAADDALWGADFLLACARRLAPGGRLSTYSERADARLAWAAAGCAVAEGEPLGAKRAGTVAEAPGGSGPPPAPSPRLAALLARRLPGWCAQHGLAECAERP